MGELHRAIAQVSVVLDKHLVPQRRMVATYRDQLKDLTDAPNPNPNPDPNPNPNPNPNPDADPDPTRT